MADKKPKQDNRDIFEKALDHVQFGLPAAGVVAGAVAGRRLSRAAWRANREVHAKELGIVKSTSADKFRYGKAERDDAIRYHSDEVSRPYQKNGARQGGLLGGIAGYGASDTMAEERKRRK